jgi:hypothetical protein
MNIQDAINCFTALDTNYSLAFERVASAWIPEKSPVTIIMAEFGRTLVSIAKNNNILKLKASLELIERCMQSENQHLRDAIATGLLEHLLSESSAGRLAFEPIALLLGETSKTFCQKWDQFTGMKTPGLESKLGTGQK